MAARSPVHGNSPETEIRSFGRKRGRKLSARQQWLLDELLAKVAVGIDPPAIDPAKLFPDRPRDIWLEIGFGGAEHLIWQAEHNPDIGLIGCEPFEEGVVKALTAIEGKGLANLRLHGGDARDVLRGLPTASIGRAFVLFPDPWPKRRHVKRRLVSTATLALLAAAMRPGAELRVATDIADYVRTMMIAFAATPQFEWQATSATDWRVRPPDWPQTRYEQKAVREGRRGYFFRFVRTP